ncbi:antibiotic biosynthesis monooxygenase [Pseudomonas syringae]|uniref:antibiotic biosynthesis monooxygenase n=1 Tax=Pseudomonas syringae TaxID=317 RepID=UPI00042A7EF1|nr:antibiotic biosynthesis monooxygenase [Pseudomonas syringae]
MATECINTIEIRLVEPLDSTFAQTARTYIDGLQVACGCLDYTMTRSPREAGLWRLTGYWESESLMTRSFDDAPMMQLLDYLIDTGASLSFGSFVSRATAAHGN